MKQEITLRYTKDNGYSYDTIFSVDDEKKTICLSDGDNDSSAGDLEEWDFVNYEDIPKVTELLKTLYSEKSTDTFSKKQKEFYNQIENADVKALFPLIVNYCEKENGSMHSFRELLDENKIKNDYSAYRSGSWD